MHFVAYSVHVELQHGANKYFRFNNLTYNKFNVINFLIFKYSF